MENYYEEENNLFFKKLHYVASLFIFFEKFGVICEFSFKYMNEDIYIFY